MKDDLPEIGSRVDVLAVLNGLRPLSLDHAKALSKRFDVAEMIFLDHAPAVA